MLTRDISLEDAILDLLDNCIDGVLRSSPSAKKRSRRPYEGYWAKISFNKDHFEITDNCGGISWKERNRAFKMGREAPVDDGLPTIGAFGIGMKRALFKMGRDCLVYTKSADGDFEVSFDQRWFSKENDWDLLPEEGSKTLEEKGTCIVIASLIGAVSKSFANSKFEEDLIKKIESHFSIFISKGFAIEINGKRAIERPIKFKLQAKVSSSVGINPYVFRSEHEGVSIFLAVGLRHEIPGVEEVIDDHEETRYSKDYAGWTIICNDRVVVYCDKTILTGWGDAGVPNYHSQFRAISGVVELTATDASLLPTTTTKRGIEASSQLYGLVKNRMREGLKIFTSYTNQWKTREREAIEHVKTLPAATSGEVKKQYEKIEMSKARGSGLRGEFFKPKLPTPKRSDTKTRIAYYKDWSEISMIADKLFGEDNYERDRETAQKVGEHSFVKALDSCRNK